MWRLKPIASQSINPTVLLPASTACRLPLFAEWLIVESYDSTLSCCCFNHGAKECIKVCSQRWQPDASMVCRLPLFSGLLIAESYVFILIAATASNKIQRMRETCSQRWQSMRSACIRQLSIQFYRSKDINSKTQLLSTWMRNLIKFVRTYYAIIRLLIHFLIKLYVIIYQIQLVFPVGFDEFQGVHVCKEFCIK